MTHDDMTIGRVKKLSLYSFIAFLGISALFAIFTVLVGKFGEFEVKVLVTTSVIAVASICSLCCSAYAARSAHRWPGVTGMALAGLSGAMVALGVWAEADSEGYWKTTAVLGLLALAAAHALALLAVRLPDRVRWLQTVTTINLLALAGLLSIMILGEMDEEGLFKVVAVLAILAALETLVVPILGKVMKSVAAETTEAATLTLTRREDGRYEDPQGRVYEVTAATAFETGNSESEI